MHRVWHGLYLPMLFAARTTSIARHGVGPYPLVQCTRRIRCPVDGLPITIAGLWDSWQDRSTGERIKSATMIITEPNAFVAEVHDRMPVILEERDFEPWLAGVAGTEILRPATNDVLQRWPVSKRVNSSRADAEDATFIEAVAA